MKARIWQISFKRYSGMHWHILAPDIGSAFAKTKKKQSQGADREIAGDEIVGISLEAEEGET